MTADRCHGCGCLAVNHLNGTGACIWCRCEIYIPRPMRVTP